MVASGVAVQRLGTDSNVFDDPDDPQSDFHALITPDVTLYLRTGLLRLTAASTVDFTYYRTYTSERGVNRTLRGRMELLLSRFRPFLGGATVHTRERPNDEIDLRADRREREVIGGVDIQLSPVTFVFGGVARTEYEVDETAVYRGVVLADQLDRREESMTLGLRRDLTPLTTLQVSARLSRDRFTRNDERDSHSTLLQTTWAFAPDALFHGELSAGFQVFEPIDRSIDQYRGLTFGGRIEWPVLSATRVDLELDRRVRFSYEPTEPYYVDTGTTLTLTQRVIGRFDVQVRGTYRDLAYRHATVAIGVNRSDHVRSALTGVGYTLGDQSRVGFNYEFTSRESDRHLDRVYDRHRLYGSWSQRF